MLMGIAMILLVVQATLFLIHHRQALRVWPNPRPTKLSFTGSFFLLTRPATYSWIDKDT